MDFKDKAGYLLVPGDLIVYGHALGRCAGLQYGKVIGITEGLCGDYQGTLIPKLRIIGVHDGPPPELLERESLLEFSERILKITESQVPANVLVLLSGYALKEATGPKVPAPVVCKTKCQKCWKTLSYKKKTRRPEFCPECQAEIAQRLDEPEKAKLPVKTFLSFFHGVMQETTKVMEQHHDK